MDFIEYYEVPNSPVAFPPPDLDNLRDVHIWTCPLCGAEHQRLYGTAPAACLACGQQPKTDRDREAWGAPEGEAHGR